MLYRYLVSRRGPLRRTVKATRPRRAPRDRHGQTWLLRLFALILRSRLARGVVRATARRAPRATHRARDRGHSAITCPALRDPRPRPTVRVRLRGRPRDPPLRRRSIDVGAGCTRAGPAPDRGAARAGRRPGRRGSRWRRSRRTLSRLIVDGAAPAGWSPLGRRAGGRRAVGARGDSPAGAGLRPGVAARDARPRRHPAGQPRRPRPRLRGAGGGACREDPLVRVVAAVARSGATTMIGAAPRAAIGRSEEP